MAEKTEGVLASIEALINNPDEEEVIFKLFNIWYKHQH